MTVGELSNHAFIQDIDAKVVEEYNSLTYNKACCRFRAVIISETGKPLFYFPKHDNPFDAASAVSACMTTEGCYVNLEMVYPTLDKLVIRKLANLVF